MNEARPQRRFVARAVKGLGLHQVVIVKEHKLTAVPLRLQKAVGGGTAHFQNGQINQPPQIPADWLTIQPYATFAAGGQVILLMQPTSTLFVYALGC